MRQAFYSQPAQLIIVRKREDNYNFKNQSSLQERDCREKHNNHQFVAMVKSPVLWGWKELSTRSVDWNPWLNPVDAPLLTWGAAPWTLSSMAMALP
jgi:hypothetical protein